MDHKFWGVGFDLQPPPYYIKTQPMGYNGHKCGFYA